MQDIKAKTQNNHPDRKRQLCLGGAGLLAGVLLVTGNIYSELGYCFYFGLLIAIVTFSSAGKTSLLAIYAFWLPYSLVLGLAVWQNVFPFIFGLILALLIGDLFSRILYGLLKIIQQPERRVFILPAVLFLVEFTFQVIPGLNKIHMVSFMSPLAYQHQLLRSASWYGGPLLLLLVALTFSFLVLQLYLHAKTRIRIAAAFALTACVTLLVLPWVVTDTDSGEKLHAAAIQGSFSPEDASADYEEILSARLDHYTYLAQKDSADITVFPETVFGLYDIEGEVDGKYRQVLADTASALGGVVVITVTEGSSLTQSRDDRFFSALVFDEGQMIGLSRKRNLVPFSETSRYSPGRDYSSHLTSRGRIGVSICYDINDLTVEKLCRDGARIILAPFNDSSFNRTYYNIHRFYPIIRAASCSVPIVVANEDGISQIIDRQGLILAELGPGKEGRIAADVILGEDLSVYLRYGFYVATAIYIVLVLFVIIIFLFRLREWINRKKKPVNI